MPLDLPTVFQTMPYAQNVAHAELVNPQIQQAVSQVLAQQFFKESNKQTQRIEKQENLATVQEDRQRHGAATPPRVPRRPPATSQTDEETQSANTTPFAGHIIDVKI